MMNVSNPNLMRAILCLCLTLSAWVGMAQNYQHHEILASQTFQTEFQCFPWTIQLTGASNGTTGWQYDSISNGIWYSSVVYNPNPGFIGLDSFSFCYNNSNNEFTCEFFEIEVIDFSIVAVNDYVVAAIDSVVTYDVLENDSTTSGVYDITIATLANHGSIQVDSDSTISFYPDPGFKGPAQYHYTICDSVGNCDIAMVTVFYEDPQDVTTVVDLMTKKNQYIDLILPLAEGHTFLSNPTGGTAEVYDADGVIRYTPDEDYFGSDGFEVEYLFNGLAKSVTYNIEVINTGTSNNFAVDDYGSGAVDENIVLSALDNDVPPPNFVPYIQSVTQPNHGTAYDFQGQITYIPDPGFEGADQFTYTVCLAGTPNCEIATVQVATSNFVPNAPEYDLQTVKNTALVIDYNIPIDDWSFTGPDGRWR